MSERTRVIIFVAGTLLLFTGVALVAHVSTSFDDTRDHSSERTNPWGTKAWRELLERSGAPTRTWSRPLSELTDEIGFLVLLDPTLPIDEEDRDALLRWVSTGGRLVVAPYAYREGRVGERAAGRGLEELLAELHVEAFTAGPVEATAHPISEHSVTADVSSVLVPTDGRLRLASEPEQARIQALIADDAGSWVALAVEFGDGRVIVLSEAEILANATLQQADNVVLAANLVFAGGAPDEVFFDEYHHGVITGEGVFAGPEVDTTPFRHTALALLAVAAIYALGRSRRFGAPEAESDQARRSSGDYVRALAQVYHRARAASASASMLAGGLRREAAAAAGMPATADDAALAGALDARGLPGEEIAELLGRLEGAGEDMTDDELLRLAQQVAHYERML